MWAERIEGVDELVAAQSLYRNPGFAWLDSRIGGADGRYSFIASLPSQRLSISFNTSEPYRAIETLECEPSRAPSEGPAPDVVPRWIGYVAYDAAWSEPPRRGPRLTRPDVPVILFHRYPAVFVFDHERQENWVVGDDRRSVKALVKALDAGRSRTEVCCAIGPIRVDDAGTHRRAIERALSYIADGQVYEVNLARRWSAPFDGDALSLWLSMRDASRVPLGMFLDAGDHAVLACTMERFIRWERQTASLITRPIKGTIDRSAGDPDARDKLKSDPKERAEHSMIVDLMRNDLGRIARIGTVQVRQPFAVEPFTGLYHLVTTVTCETRPDVSLRDVVEATFPPGSVTGAPKIRAVEVIEELERHPRGVYCGAVGFVDRAGGLSLAVAIRTATVREQHVEYWAGGGIVEASDPEREVAETELKAQVFLGAVRSQGRSSSIENHHNVGQEEDQVDYALQHVATPAAEVDERDGQGQ